MQEKTLTTSATPTDPPIALAALSSDGVTVSIKCPYCGKRHTHGASGVTTNGLSHRLSHCVRRDGSVIENRGYYLRLKERPGGAPRRAP